MPTCGMRVFQEVGMKALINRIFSAFHIGTFLIVTHLFYKYRFGYIGPKSILFGRFTSITNPERIYIGGNSRVLKGARLDCVTSWMGENFHPTVRIGRNVNIGQNFFLSCASMVEIGDGVLISDNVAIIDNDHMNEKGVSFSHTPISSQDITIENNVLIYRNSIILKGSYIEEGAVIGANSIIKGRVSKNSLVVGSPMKVVKNLYGIE